MEIYKTIPLKASKIMEISKFDLKDKNAEYAHRFSTNEFIENLWEDDTHSFLRFKISATDSLSGFGRVFHKDYHIKKNSINRGVHEFGNSFEIN